MSGMGIDGVASGLDTATIIKQLMQIERSPQLRLQTKHRTHKSQVDAYGLIRTKLNEVKATAKSLAAASDWQLRTATSSDNFIAKASVAAGAVEGTFSFKVNNLATNHTQVSIGTVGSSDALAATGNLTLTDADGDAHTINVGDGSLKSVVAAINASDAGVRAAAVQVAPGSYRLQLTAKDSGAGEGFTLDTTNLHPDLAAGFNTVNAGQNAELVIGDPLAGGYTIQSKSNTVTDVRPGVTLNLVKADPAEEVTVTIAADTNALANRVMTLVAKANETIAEIDKHSKIQADGTPGGVLSGDSLARQLRSEVMAALGGNAALPPSKAGITISRAGVVEFDRAKFLTNYEANPNDVEKVFTATGTSSSSDISFVFAGTRASEGNHAIVVTAAATKAAITGNVVGGGSITADDTLSFTIGSETITYDATNGDSLTSIRDGLNTLFAEKSFGLVASVEGGALVVRTSGYGSGAQFTASSAAELGIVGTNVAGTDVAGTIDGVAATGIGQVLTTGASVPAAASFSVLVAASGPTSATITYQAGLAERVNRATSNQTQEGVGRLATTIKAKTETMDRLNKDIAAWDLRLVQREKRLRRQFTGLETAMGQLKAQGSWLGAQLAGLMAPQ